MMDLNFGGPEFNSSTSCKSPTVKQVFSSITMFVSRLFIAGFHCHAIKNKDDNHSINYVKSLRYDRRMIYKQPREDLGLYGFSCLCDSQKYFTQI